MIDLKFDTSGAVQRLEQMRRDLGEFASRTMSEELTQWEVADLNRGRSTGGIGR